MELVTEEKNGFKKTEVGFIPEDWEVKSLDELSEKITVGIASSATHAYRNRGVVLLRNQNIKKGWLDDSDLKFISEDYAELHKTKKLRTGDLITARTGYPGSTCIIPEKYDGVQTFTTLITRPKKDSCWSPFLNHYINSEIGQNFFETNQIGGGQKNVNAGTLCLMPIPLPPTLEEQQAIATALSDVDELIRSLDRLIQKKEAIKKGTMQQLLTGQKRLPGFEGEWEVKRLGDVGELITGGTPSTTNKEFWNGTVPWITPTDIEQSKDIYTSDRLISEQGLSQVRKLPKDTLLVTCIASIGKNAILRQSGACNQQINAVVTNDNHDVDFLYYLIGENKDLLMSNSGKTATAILSKKKFGKIEFSFPSLEEQKAIAQILSDMDEELQTLRQKRDKIRRVKEGMMQELLTGKVRLV